MDLITPTVFDPLIIPIDYSLTLKKRNIYICVFISRNSITKRAVGSVSYTPTEVLTILIFDEGAFNAEVKQYFSLFSWMIKKNSLDSYLVKS